MRKTFPGLGSATLHIDAHGNKQLQIDSNYAPESYVVPTDKGLGIAQNYLEVDKALFTGAGGQALPLMTRWEKLRAFAYYGARA